MTPIDKIYALGPEGTFSDHAARRLIEHLERAGDAASPTIIYTGSIPESLERASLDIHSRAVAPLENSETGAVLATQDYLAKYGVFIELEINVRVRFNLVSDTELREVTRLYTHPVAHGQCDVFLAKHCPKVDVVFTRSNVDSGLRWANGSPDERTAAIVPSDYSPVRPPPFQHTDIQNHEHNTTRFVVVRGGAPSEDFSRGKTALLIEPDADRPGLLFEILTVFKRYGINLCRIESRPARTRPWAYVFYMDITNNAHSREAIAELRSGKWKVILLGTFDVLPDKT